MRLRPPLVKAALKRGALITVANWPLPIVQAVTASLFKLLVVVPLVGGALLVALTVGTDPGTLIELGWREMAATIVTSLGSHRDVLLVFALGMAVVVTGGALLVFFAKGGTVEILVAAEREAGPVETPPLRGAMMADASRFTLERFEASARALFPRYAQLGALLGAVYLASTAGYLAVVASSRAMRHNWAIAVLVTVAFAAWISVVNLVYLLLQIAMAADRCGVTLASRRVAAFLTRTWPQACGVFLVILAMIAAANGVALLVAGALSLIAFVPFVGQVIGLAILPLQLTAWLLREVVFQYIGLASIGAYARLYRDDRPQSSSRPNG